MNRHDLESAARALESSGYRFYRATSSDGANLRSYEPVDWQTAIGRLMNATGWVIGPEVDETTKPELRIEP